MRGHILLSVLIALSIITGLTSTSIALCLQYMQTRTAISSELRHRGPELESAVTSMTGPSGETRSCLRGEAICLSRYTAPPPQQIILGSDGSFPTFQIRSYLTAELPCPIPLITPSLLESPSGRPLTPGAVIDRALCALSTLPSQPRVGFRENVSLASSLIIPPAVEILWSGGYLEAADTVSVQAPLRIIAAGDLMIPTLQAPPGAQVPITLVSLTGTVSVETLVGPVWLKVVARNGTTLPAPLPVMGDNQQLPEYRRYGFE